MSEPTFEVPAVQAAESEIAPAVAAPWKVLIVDDDVMVHETTRYAIGPLKFRGRSLLFISAFSAQEAREVFQQHHDIALALVDVVMETTYSGLDLVRYIREDVGDRMVSLILRTGQPGYAPEQSVILDYEINDYKSKTELTSTILVTAVVSALRTHANHIAMNHMAKQLEAQLLKSEKMATLGLLVAKVAHDINTPISSIKSSGQSVREAVGEMLMKLPVLFQVLETENQLLFMQLLSQAKDVSEVRNSRQTRTLVRGISARLEQAGIADAQHQAGILAHLNAESELLNYLPLLRHTHSRLILETVESVAAILRSSININTAVDSVSKIVLALKSFAHVNQTGEKTYASLQGGLETVLTIYQYQIKLGVEVQRHFEALEPVLCFPDELNQVWTNLIHNALQAMNHNGTLHIGLRRDGDCAVVSVGDTGCGIPEDIRVKIFDLFFTTKPVGEGSGLGLDIVKKIVEKHHGRIDVQSEVGVGTTFSVFLPIEP